MKRKYIGFFHGAMAAASYGMNPLFALPLYGHGVGVNSVLFYRYIFATVLLALWMKLKKHSFKIDPKQLGLLFVMGMFFSLSSLFLFVSYQYMDAGVASTLLFVYPVLVAIIMILFYREKISREIFISIIFTILGIYFLYTGKNNEVLNLKGVIFVFISALLYALYIVGVRQTSLKKLSPEKLSFYVLIFGSLVYIYNTNSCTQIDKIPEWYLWVNAIGLALLPTIISLESMTIAIKLLGATPAAILGTLEPVTALCIGVVVFHETLTVRIILGVIFILISVLGVILNKHKKRIAEHSK